MSQRWYKGWLVLAAVILVPVALLYYFGQQRQRRIVPDLGGALMAVDADGLRELYSLYALPKICADPGFRKTADYLSRCMRAVQIPGSIKKGMVLLPPGTRAISTDARHILRRRSFRCFLFTTEPGRNGSGRHRARRTHQNYPGAQ
jgi:hypothetical protein